MNPEVAPRTARPGQRMKAWRLKRKVSAGDLADRLECSRSMVHQMERGAAKPGRALANRIAGLLAIPVPDWDRPAAAEEELAS